MLLHIYFVLRGLIQVQKRIQNLFENVFGNFKNTNKRVFFLPHSLNVAFAPLGLTLPGALATFTPYSATRLAG